MKRIAVYLVAAVVVVVLGLLFFVGQRRLKAMEGRINDLNARVIEATQLAKEEAVAASAASQVAAGGRAQAEQQSQQAKAGQVQAESAARQAAEQAQQARTQLDTLRKQREEELNQMQQALSHVVETRRTANGMVMVLPDSVFKFGFDNADLNERNRELLSRIAGILLVSKGYGLSIFGYTDDVGSRDYNQKLSERRANAVRSYLVQAGLNASIINTKGYGKTNPLISGDSDGARAKNRRVEIALTDSEIKYIGEADSAQ